MQAWQHIPQEDILANDLLIFCDNKQPVIGEICIIPIENVWLLVRLVSQDEDGRFLCKPLSFDDKEGGIIEKPVYEKKNGSIMIDQKNNLASAIALKRTLAI